MVKMTTIMGSSGYVDTCSVGEGVNNDLGGNHNHTQLKWLQNALSDVTVNDVKRRMR